MKRRPGVEIQPNSLEDYITQNAQNIPLQLDAAPTTAGAELPTNGDWGVFGSNLYINLFGTTFSIALTST